MLEYYFYYFLRRIKKLIKYRKYIPIFLMRIILWEIPNILFLRIFLIPFTKDYMMMSYLIMSISLLFAFSETGEALLRMFEGMRPLYTSKLIYHLEPIFEEVKTTAEEKRDLDLSHLRIYVIDTLEINAIALGRSSIALTRGAVNGLSDEAIRGLLAHEMAHIIHKDTVFSLLAIIGNLMYTFTFKALSFALNKLINDLERVNIRGLATLILKSIASLVSLICFVYEQSNLLFLATNSRKAELKADNFAYEIGYGEELIEALYVFDDLTANDKQTLKKIITASHPLTAKRIALLETR